MHSNDELERREFEEWFKRDFHPDKTGPYVKDQLYFAWIARAKQEQSDGETDLSNQR